MNELSYITVEEAIGRPGLRVAFSQGLPGPWGVGARAILEFKNIPFAAVAQEVGGGNVALLRWTGQSSAPVAVLGDEKPRASWSEIILLAERLAPEPRLIPQDAEARALMFGLCHELCGEDGLGWCLRLMLFALRERNGDLVNPALIRKYDSGAGFEHAKARVNALTAAFGDRLATQSVIGSNYLVGSELTAADIYLAAFSHLLRGFPEEICEMPAHYRARGDVLAPSLDGLPEILFEHRHRVLKRCLRLPFKF